MLGYLYENSTGDMRFAFTGLTPYTRYTVAVRAKAAGEVGPAAEDDVTTFAEGEESTHVLTHLFLHLDEYVKDQKIMNYYLVIWHFADYLF